MSVKNLDELYEYRRDWLEKRGRTVGDIIFDKKGLYVNNDGEDGYEKEYLPDNLQELE